MRTAKKYTFTIALLTALGVLPVPGEAAQNRSQVRPQVVDLEGAPMAAAVKQIPGDIRSGRLGH
jgi:hypothetical protein